MHLSCLHHCLLPCLPLFELKLQPRVRWREFQKTRTSRPAFFGWRDAHRLGWKVRKPRERLPIFCWDPDSFSIVEICVRVVLQKESWSSRRKAKLRREKRMTSDRNRQRQQSSSYYTSFLNKLHTICTAATLPFDRVVFRERAFEEERVQSDV